MANAPLSTSARDPGVLGPPAFSARRAILTSAHSDLLAWAAASPVLSGDVVIDPTGATYAWKGWSLVTNRGLYVQRDNATAGVNLLAANSNSASFFGSHCTGTLAGTLTQSAVDKGTFFGSGAYDGTNWFTGARIELLTAELPTAAARGHYMVFSTILTGATTLAERMRISSAGNLLVGTASDTGLTGSGGLKVASTTASSSTTTGSGIFAGGIGVAKNSYFGATLTLADTLFVNGSTQAVAISMSGTTSGGTTCYGLLHQGTIGSGVTSGFSAFQSAVSTAAASFTLTTLRHFIAGNVTLGSGSAVTNQYGFQCADLTSGGTTNIGFKGDVTSGSGKYNLYMQGSAQNYLVGVTGIGAAPSSTTALIVAASTTGVSSLRIPHGSAPTTPVDGDMWTTTAGAFIRINGTTKTFTLT